MYNFYFCLCRGELGAVRDWCSALHLLQNSCSHDKYLSFLPEHLFGFTAEGSSQSPEQLLTGTLPGLISAYWGKGGSEFAGISVPNIPCLCFVLLRVSLLFFHLHLVMWSVCFFSHSFFFISNLCKISFWGLSGHLLVQMESLPLHLFAAPALLVIVNWVTWLAVQCFFSPGGNAHVVWSL